MTLTKTQHWFQHYSDRLGVSFRASGQIEHRVTKGETREHQVLDVLKEVLPLAVTLEHGVVIIDSADVEAPIFDGVFFNRRDWPLLYRGDPHKVVMVESVLAAIETKSLLDGELEDVFKKGQRLRALQWNSRIDALRRPLYLTFAYECRNPNLAFFDFAVYSSRNPGYAPGIVAVLNVGLFVFREPGGGLAFLPGNQDHPLYLKSGSDTLLILVYLLCRQVSESDVAEVFKGYSEEYFKGVPAFSFEPSFLQLLSSNDDACQTARSCFSGTPDLEIGELYDKARKALGL